MSTPDDSALLRYAHLLQRLPDLHDGLRQAAGVADLLARGARLCADECGFERGLILGIEESALTAEATDPLLDPASDRLRRLVLEEPITISSGSLEAELIRRPNHIPREQRSTVQEALELTHPAFAAIAPEGNAIALLVMDRPASAPVGDDDRGIVALMGRMLSVVIEHVALRARIGELAAEVRYLTVSMQALAHEAFEGPIALPVQGRHLPAFRGVEATRSAAPESVRGLLSDRELEIAALLSRGRSNREIAEALFLSTETVKDNVGRLMRKLGATNRVELAVRFLGLHEEAPPSGGG